MSPPTPQPSPRVPGSPSPPLVVGRWRVASAIVATAVLMVLGFPDWSIDVLAWVALLPLVAVTRGAGGRRGFLLGWACGAIIEGIGFRWILGSIVEFTGFNGWLSPVALLFFLAWLLYSSLSWGIFGWLLGRCERPAMVHAAVLAWVGVEYYFPRLFPWHLGGAFYERPWLRQAADLFGASGLSYLVLLVTSALYLTLEWRASRARFPLRTVLACGLLLVAANVYGALRLRQVESLADSAPRVQVALVQPALPPDEKARPEVFWRVLGEALGLSRREGVDVDLVVLPEGMDPFPFDVDPRMDPLGFHPRPGGKSLFEPFSVPLVLGGMSIDPASRHWNTAAYLRPSGHGTGSASVLLYHKNHRLLFGEKLPFQDFIPTWVMDRVQVGTLERGTECPRFTLPADTDRPALAFRILICYEAVLPGYVRRQAPQVDFLVNVTEDIWYGRSAHIRQHESVLRMRCVESRVAVVRCTNMGPSGVIGPAGDFKQRTREWAPDSRIVSLRPVRTFSLFRAGGYLMPAAALVVAFFILVKYNFRNS